MTEYAVINPATGERVTEYPTISDDALAATITGADRAHPVTCSWEPTQTSSSLRRLPPR